jgi:uncharacterized protein (TIGR03437 family)
MKLSIGVGMLGTMLAAISAGQPVITGLLNNYSFVQPGLPHYGIAQGSIFDIFGTNLASGSSPLQSPPLMTTLAGVSVSVTVGSVTAPLILYFTQPGQIAAILPSRVPVGTGQITVTSLGQTSAPFPIQVVQSAFGILTLNGEGSAAAAVFDSASKYLGFTNAVNPGEYITIWGTGLGPVTGDETQPQTPLDLVNIPIEVDIGGAPATVAYHGRSTYSGLDQINAIVPAGVQGCFTSLVVRTGNIVSNFASIPVVPSGRTCSDPVIGVSSAQIQTLSSLNFVTRGRIAIAKDATTTPGPSPGSPATVTTSEVASAEFVNVLPFQAGFIGSMFEGLGASLGSCMVWGINPSGTIIAPDFDAGTSLDAGSALNVTGPAGSALMTVLNPSIVYLYTKLFNAGFIPNLGGTFTFNHVPNDPETGADLKTPISAKITLPPPPVWTNQSTISSVDRVQGVTVTWSGGDPDTYVTIAGSSVSGTGPPVGSYFNCSAPVSAGRFTIPTTVLSSLPRSSAISPNSFLRVGNTTLTQNFVMTGVHIGLISAGWTFTTNLTYQ